MNKERRYFIVTAALCGVTSVAILGGIASMEGARATGQRSAPPGEPQPTATYGPGKLVEPLPEGITLPPESSEDGEPLLEVVSTWGDVYKVKKMETGQYKIIYPEPTLLEIKFLRESDISAFQ